MSPTTPRPPKTWPELSSRLLALTCDADNPRRLASFWSGVLGREIVDDPGGGALLPGSPTQVGLRFAPSSSVKNGQNRVHLHLTSTSLDAQRETVAAALALGAVHIDVGQRPDEGFVVLADPTPAHNETAANREALVGESSAYYRQKTTNAAVVPWR